MNPASRGRAIAMLLLGAAVLAPAGALAEGFTEKLVVQAGGRAREALVWYPAEDFQPRRMVVMLHGAGGDPERIRRFTARGLERAARAGQWLVVYPHGVDGTWNDCRRQLGYPARRKNVADVAFLSRLIHELRERYGLQPGDVVAAGYSNGAHMALRLALEERAQLGGLVMVAAQLPIDTVPACSLANPALHVLHIAGTLDPIVPFTGGTSIGPSGDDLGEVRSAAATVDAFVAAAGGGPVTWTVLPERDGHLRTSVAMAEWLACGRVIRQYVLHGAGHVVPQREVVFPAIAGVSSGDVDFGEIMLEFVGRWPLAGARCGGP